MTRLPRRWRRAVFAAAACVLLAGPAHGAGTGGIEVTPVPGVVDGKQVTAFHVTLPTTGTTQQRFALRNITTEERAARIYAASARRDGKGGFSIGDPGSSPYVRLPDRTVTLQPAEVRAETFDVVAPSKDRPGEETYAAVVLEVQRGSIVQRAATLVYVAPGEKSSAPPWLLVVAGSLLGLALLAFLFAVVRRRTGRTLRFGG